MVITETLLRVVFIFVRVTGMILPVPIFGSRNVPAQVKAGFVFFLSIAALPMIQMPAIETELIVGQFLSIVISEFTTGFAMGLVTTIILSFVYIAGILIDRNIGFAMVSVVNPTGEDQLPVTANLFYLISLMVFLVTSSHHMLIRALLNSFKLVPIGGIQLEFSLIYQLVQLLTKATVLGFQIAAPFLITIFIANVLLGLLSKAMPGMNVFILGMPFKLFFGLILFIVVIPYLGQILIQLYQWLGEYLMYFPRLMT